MIQYFEKAYQKKSFRAAFFSILFLIGALTVLTDIDVRPLQNWDESLFAMRAYYLMNEGGILSNFDYFEGYGYHPNVKPPFTTFLQAPIFHLLGYGELGLRLPIALLSVLCGLSLFLFARKESGSPFGGLFAALVLFTSIGYVTLHVGRTGDQDVATAFYMLLMLMAFYRYHQHRESPKGRRYALFFGLAMAAAAFTKTIFAFFFLPAIALFILFKKQLGWYLRHPLLIIVSMLVIGSYGGYVYLMDVLHPGYLDTYIHHAAGRFSVLVDNHIQEPPLFYFHNLFTDFVPWIYILPLGIFALFRKELVKYHDLLLLTFLAMLTLLIVISISKTKLHWYITPFYPVAALVTGLILEEMRVRTLEGQGNKARFLTVGVLLFALFITPYQRVLANNKTNNQEDDTNQRYTSIMKKLQQERPELKTYTIFAKPYTPSVSFFATLYNQKHGYNITVLDRPGPHEVGEQVLICLHSRNEDLQSRYELQEEFERYGCVLYKVTGAR
ncbi:MAG: glycosyltransferase family 39 protein [Phaeodactylibacter sp.]|nr:glycosyltransferase family 39 protein [Phaeodactylibacter sp.]